MNKVVLLRVSRVECPAGKLSDGRLKKRQALHHSCHFTEQKNRPFSPLLIGSTL